MSHPLLAVAEHEAAHAVVATVFGAKVLEIGVRSRGDGWTKHEGTADRAASAAITAAGDTWQRHLSTLPYRDLSCDDLANFEAEHGFSALWQAERTALRVLAQHRRAVAALADRIARERHIVYDPAVLLFGL